MDIMLILSKLLQLKICMLHLICVYFFSAKTVKPQMLKESHEFARNTASTLLRPLVVLVPSSLSLLFSGAAGDSTSREEGTGRDGRLGRNRENELQQAASADLLAGGVREWGTERAEMKKKDVSFGIPLVISIQRNE